MILNAANGLIAHNTNRKPKELWTQNDAGKPLTYYLGFDEYEEIDFVIQQIKNLTKNSQYTYNDIAILYRTNAQSRLTEEKLAYHKLPVRLIGGLKFYSRQEIKDMIAYLQLIHNPHNFIAFSRAIQRPSRRIGATSLEKLNALSTEKNKSLYELIAADETLPVSATQHQTLKSFFDMILSIKSMYDSVEEKKIEIVLDAIIRQSGYRDMLDQSHQESDLDRLDNIYELKSMVKDEVVPLGDFLNSLVLLTDLDNTPESQNAITLMTLHHAKGLEFPIVFIMGVEERLLPFIRTKSDTNNLEEERRLAYVGITRGETLVYLSGVYQRTLYGEQWYHDISRFIKELPKNTFQGKVSERVYSNASILEPLIENKISYQCVSSSEKPTIHSTPQLLDLQEGDLVDHKVWGKGHIVKLEGSDEKLMYHISFKGDIRKLMAKYTPIRKV